MQPQQVDSVIAYAFAVAVAVVTVVTVFSKSGNKPSFPPPDYVSPPAARDALEPRARAAVPEHQEGDAASWEVKSEPYEEGNEQVSQRAVDGGSESGFKEVEEDDRPSWAARRSPLTPVRKVTDAASGFSYVALSDEEEDDPSWISRKPSSSNQQSTEEHQHNNLDVNAEVKNKMNDSEIARALDEYVEAPSWMSQREPSFLAHDYLPTVQQQHHHEPGWMSRKDPTPIRPLTTSAVSTNGTTTVVHRAGSKHKKIATLNELISHNVFADSDAVFVYPIAQARFLGEILAQNAHDKKHDKVRVVETRAGAGRLVLGAASSSSDIRVGVLASSKSLRFMIPSITELAERRLPVTFQIACASLWEEEMSWRIDHTDIGVVRDVPGATILFSSDNKDAYEMASVSMQIANMIRGPVLHAFDSAGRLNRVSDFPASALPAAFSSFSKDSGSVAEIVASALRSVRRAPFEYFGSPDARVVIVAMGAAAREAELFVENYANKKRGNVIGCVRVRMLRPWSAEELLRAVPSTAVRVCVLDQSQNLALFGDVASAFASDPRTAKHVQVSYTNVPPTFRGVGPQLIHTVFDELVLSEEERSALMNASASVASSSGAKSSNLRSLCIYVNSKHTKATEHAARVVAESVAKHCAHVRVATYTDDLACENGQGLSLVELRVSDSAGDEDALERPIEPSRADVVIVADKDAFHAPQIDLFGALKEGGTIVFPSGHQLSLIAKRRASAKNAHVLYLDTSSGEECDVEGWSSVSAGLRLLSEDNFHRAISDLVSAFRDTNHHGLGWMAMNDATRKLESGFFEHEGSTNNATATSFVQNGKNGNGINYPRRLGHLFQQSQSNVSFADDASQTGMSEYSTTTAIPSSLFSGDVSMFGLIPRVAVLGTKHSKLTDTEEKVETEVVRPHEIAWNVVFKDAYETDAALRPREHDTFKVRLVTRKRLTPVEYERNIFHLEFDISGTELKYQIGDALGVFGHNDSRETDDFMARYNATGGSIDPDSFLAFHNPQTHHHGKTEMVSVRNLFLQHLDLYGRPTKKFYVWLAKFAKSRYEHLKLLHTGTDDAEGFKLGVAETLTFADVLLQHSSARPSVEELASVIPTIKARHYSIASSMKFSPRSVSLLVVAVDWISPQRKVKRYGQCTRYLANLDLHVEGGCYVTVDVVPSVLRLPPRSEQPIIMAGLGTGMAPFRAFVQERKVQKENGEKVGEIFLYFGARHRHEEYLYGEEWDAYFKEGLVTRLGLAFSRDQKEKVYIQHKIKDDADLLKELFVDKQGYFYLCGPTWPVPDIRDAVASGLDPVAFAKGSTDVVDQLKDEGRYILEVY